MAVLAFVLAFVAAPLIGTLATLAAMLLFSGLGSFTGGLLSGLAATLAGSWLAVHIFSWLGVSGGLLSVVPVLLGFLANDLHRIRTRGATSFNVFALLGGLIGVGLAAYFFVPDSDAEPAARARAVSAAFGGG